MPKSLAVLPQGIDLLLGDLIGDRQRAAGGRHVVVDGGHGPLGPPDLPAGEPQRFEGLGAGHLMDELQVDVQDRLLAFFGMHDVMVPYLLEHCPGIGSHIQAEVLGSVDGNEKCPPADNPLEGSLRQGDIRNTDSENRLNSPIVHKGSRVFQGPGRVARELRKPSQHGISSVAFSFSKTEGILFYEGCRLRRPVLPLGRQLLDLVGLQQPHRRAAAGRERFLKDLRLGMDHARQEEPGLRQLLRPERARRSPEHRPAIRRWRSAKAPRPRYRERVGFALPWPSTGNVLHEAKCRGHRPQCGLRTDRPPCSGCRVRSWNSLSNSMI